MYKCILSIRFSSFVFVHGRWTWVSVSIRCVRVQEKSRKSEKIDIAKKQRLLLINVKIEENQMRVTKLRETILNHTDTQHRQPYYRIVFSPAKNVRQSYRETAL